MSRDDFEKTFVPKVVEKKTDEYTYDDCLHDLRLLLKVNRKLRVALEGYKTLAEQQRQENLSNTLMYQHKIVGLEKALKVQTRKVDVLSGILTVGGIGLATYGLVTLLVK